MQQTAHLLGTPKLGYSQHNDARTRSMFEFVSASQSVDNWTKMFTVVATRVAEDRTQAETKGLIVRIRSLLTQKHAKVSAYDVRDQAPPVAYFKYVIEGETDAGVIFSPAPGIVTIQQVAARHGGVITAQDIRHIKGLIGAP